MAKRTFTFKDEGLEQNLADFVTDQPIPTGVDGKPKYTPAQWWKAWVLKNTKQAIQKGKNKRLAQLIDNDIIQ